MTNRTIRCETCKGAKRFFGHPEHLKHDKLMAVNAMYECKDCKGLGVIYLDNQNFIETNNDDVIGYVEELAEKANIKTQEVVKKIKSRRKAAHEEI